jgi:hypothetical protein
VGKIFPEKQKEKSQAQIFPRNIHWKGFAVGIYPYRREIF